MSTHIKSISLSCILITFGIVLGYIESLIPIVTFPGLKIGLSNLVILYALFKLNFKYLYIIGFIKAVVNGFLFSGIISILYSSFSIIISISVMCILKKIFFPKQITVYGLSIVGSVCFNITQILTASLLLKTSAVFYYMPFMTIASIFTGIITAFIIKLILNRFED